MKKIIAIAMLVSMGLHSAEEPAFIRAFTPLLKAVYEDDCKKLVELLEQGEDQTTVSALPAGGIQVYPLYEAVAKNSECMVRALLNAPGALDVVVKPIITYSAFGSDVLFFTPLAAAVTNNNHSIAALLLEKMRQFGAHPRYAHVLITQARDDKMKKMLQDYE